MASFGGAPSLGNAELAVTGKTFERHNIFLRLVRNLYLPFIEKTSGWMFNLSDDVDPLYQQLATEAFDTLGVAPTDRLVLKVIKNEGMASIFTTISDVEKILINQNKIKNWAYGAKRFLMFREAVFIQRAEHIKSELLAPTGLLSHWVLRKLATSSYAPPMIESFVKEHVNSWKKIFGVQILIFLLLDKLYNLERRMKQADLEGARACACHCCVKEAAGRRFYRAQISYDNLAAYTQQNMGYACADELLIIAEELSKQNLVCTYHAQKN